ncbi:MAG TPA: FkbM family methyltransferase [Candidatus Limnocylindria bacterium]|nr:FkbM family methyltransferase [Candidatus Limnocylindria bacterium]
MKTNTKSLFISILKAQRSDCVCDIGSRDGDQSLLFRHLLPNAAVIAFEANPINFEMMQANPNLKDNRIELFPYAISNQRGTAGFHITDVDYADSEANRGTSSLLVAEGQKIKKTVDVETVRIDEFISSKNPSVERIGLWIDVEGAEYAVLEGIGAIRDRIVAISVETTNEPRWEGQKPLRDLDRLMAGHGFVPCGSNFGGGPTEWGDVVFVQRRIAAKMGFGISMCRFKAFASYFLGADQIAVLLKNRAPWLYRILRHLYIKVGT